MRKHREQKENEERIRQAAEAAEEARRIAAESEAKAKREAAALAERRRQEEFSRTFTSPTTGARFVLIPAGTFTMGSPANEPGRLNDERQRRSDAFYLQTTEVTQGQWRKVMGNNPSYFKNCGDDCPVEQVSWNDVQEFIRKLNSMEGTDKYRLPTEGEWEYAARAGTTTAFSFGDSESKLGDYGWYDGNSGRNTHPAGQKRPNPWGLYDVHGNVWEWAQDIYEGGSVRVFRGGSWFNYAGRCRSARRNGYDPGNRFSDLGFRLARTK
jgi:formylglycine-generating enzyme required for sulfatase activity